MLPSLSVLAAPFSVTVKPEVIVWLAPAFAVGRLFGAGFTVIVTVAAPLLAKRLSVTTSEKVNVVATVTSGAMNVGCAVAPPVKRDGRARGLRPRVTRDRCRRCRCCPCRSG